MESNFAGLLSKIFDEQIEMLKKQSNLLKDFAKTGNATKKQKQKDPVDPNKPKKPLSGYQLFMADRTNPYKIANPSISQTEIMSIVAKQWGLLDQSSKQSYLDKASKQKAEYEEKMKKYNASIKNTSSNNNNASTPASPTPVKSEAVKIPDVAHESGQDDSGAEKKKKKKRKDDHHHHEGEEEKKKKKHKKDRSESESH